MGYRIVFASILFFQTFAHASFADGACTFETTGNPGLPKAVCAINACPSGGDCSAPTVDKRSAKIDFFEPVYEWKDKCPGGGIESGCWEVYFDFKFRVAASDPSGVAYVGLVLANEIDGVKTTRKFLAKADKKSEDGRYEMTAGSIFHVAPPRKLAVYVAEICTKDTLGNEACVTP